jgi:hypothetical protein
MTMSKITDIELKSTDLLEKELQEAKARLVDLIKENALLKKELDKYKVIENMSVQESGVLGPDNKYIGATDEETICRVQLHLLNNASMLRELTMEETKKVEIYTKLLSQINNTKKKQPNDALDSLSDTDLLKIVSEL